MSIDLSKEFQQLFGYKSDAFDPKFEKVTGNSINDFDRKEFGDQGAEYYAYDDTGREYFLPVTIQVPSDTGALQTYQLPYPVVSIRGSSHYVDTPLTDRQGAVSEFININNYEVTIRGMMVARTNEFPEGLNKQLQQLHTTGLPMSFICAATDMYLQPLGGMVTLRAFDVPALPGVKHVRGYTLQFMSDSIFELTDIS